MEDLKKRWYAALADTDKCLVSKWWDIVCSYYSEPSRHYHTLDHLVEMFGHYECSKHHFQYPRLVSLAVFFHDLIYDPKMADNEERSAEKFEEFVKMGAQLSEEECNLVKSWILKTKSHEVKSEETEEEDMHFFLDIDMAVLGRDEKGYDDYASDIRSEYIHVPEEIYRTRRAQVLEDFSKRLPLFSTKLFRTKYEEQAKLNLQREIKRLKDPSILL